MSWRWPLILLILAAIVGLYLNGSFSEPETPREVGDGWWGRGEKETTKVDESIRKFHIKFGNDTIADLKTRLKNTRFFEGLEGTKFHYGVRPEYMKTVVKYWQEKYDFAEEEKYFNAYDHYLTNIEGIDVHFMHIKPKLSPGQKSKPLLIIHGWPGSVYEFYKIIPMLTDPLNHGGNEEDIFEVICPSIPGYGFSEAAHKPGLNIWEVARIFGKLMTRLGHKEYYVQGGDWGSYISTSMALILPQHVKGMHVNMAMYQPPMYIARLIIGSIFPSLILPEKDHHRVWPAWDKILLFISETGYLHIQATKPDTIGHALTDSPVGLAAYILEKFSTGKNLTWLDMDDGGLDKGWRLEDLLNNVMVYWLNGNMASAMRLYKETFTVVMDECFHCPVNVPSGIADFPGEEFNAPESWLRYKYINLIHYNSLPKGGHFAALECPELLASEIRQFVQKVEQL